MKLALRLLIVLLFAFIIGCSSQSPSSSAPETSGTETEAEEDQEEATTEPVELEFYYPVAVGGPLTEIIENMTNEFNEEHPHIKVKPVYTGDYAETMTKTQTAIQGGASPDVAVLLSTELYTLLDMDAIVPMDDFMTKDELNSYYPAFMDNAQTAGKTWSIPFQRSTIVLYYNKDAFAEAGLDPNKPPTTWEELVDYSKKLSKDGSYGVEIPTSGYTYWMFNAFALQNGKNLMSDDGTEVYFDTPENLEALNLWVDLAKEHKAMPEGVIDWATTPSDFLEGKTAMMYHSTGNLTNVKSKAEFDFGVSFLPGNKDYGSPTGGGSFYIFKDIEENKQQAAAEFAKWMTTPERAAQWSMDTGYVAVSPEAYETETMKAYVEEFPPAAIARDQLEHAAAELSTHQNGRIYQIINDHLQAAVTGELSPEEALKQAQEEADKVLKPFQK